MAKKLGKKKILKKTPKKSAKKKAKMTAAPKKPAKKMDNVVVWFEIPVTNIERAARFYSAVLGIKMEVMGIGDSQGAMFPYEMGVASGALIQSNENRPSTMGSMIYLNGGKDLSVPLSRVLSAGGKVIQEKLEIGENGFMAIFEDTEGNHVALHSMS